LQAFLDNQRDHPFEIVPQVRRPNSQCFDALAGKPVVASLVALGISPQLMCNSIDLDTERRIVAKKIQYVGA